MTAAKTTILTETLEHTSRSMEAIATTAAENGRLSVADNERGVIALALDADARHQALVERVAPDFTLPDLDGTARSFSEWGGTKRLLFAWSSWLGFSYDLPGWQALQDELTDDNFQIVSVAVQESGDGLDQFVDGITFPVLIDREHVLTELFAISNVPTVVWIDEQGRIVRPNAVMFGTDTFKDFTGVDSETQKDQIRAWVKDGELGADADTVVADLTDDEVRARLHFRIGAHLLREGDEPGGREHLQRAGDLAPHDFTIRRAAMPLLGEDPFGEGFFSLYEEWKSTGEQYHGIGITRPPTQS